MPCRISRRPYPGRCVLRHLEADRRSFDRTAAHAAGPTQFEAARSASAMAILSWCTTASASIRRRGFGGPSGSSRQETASSMADCRDGKPKDVRLRSGQAETGREKIHCRDECRARGDACRRSHRAGRRQRTWSMRGLPTSVAGKAPSAMAGFTAVTCRARSTCPTRALSKMANVSRVRVEAAFTDGGVDRTSGDYLMRFRRDRG